MDITRRQALGLGAAALGALRFPATALASHASGPDLFELPLGRLNSTTWHLTPVIQAPKRFDLVGLRWDGGAHVHAQTRARRHGGRWTRWTPLPHPHAPLDGTDPAYTGAADELQFRLRGHARQLTARLVKTLPASLTAHASQTPTGAPAMVMRAQWGGDSVPPRNPPLYGQVQAAFVHHTAGEIDYAPEDSPGIVLGIARYHRDSNGWNDIGYNFLVDRYGTIFEGRAGGIEAAVIGAQAQGYNSNSTGIACLGTFTNIPLDDPAMESLAKLIGWKLSLHGVPTQGTVTIVSQGGETNRYRNGTPVVLQRINGHRDGDQTSCPGDQLYAQLPDLQEPRHEVRGPGQRDHRQGRLPAGRQADAGLRPDPLRRRLEPRGRPAEHRVHDRRLRLDPGQHDHRRRRRRLGDERRPPGQRPGPRHVRRRRHAPARGIGPDQGQGRAEHEPQHRQAPRAGRHGVRRHRHDEPRPAPARLPARAPVAQPLGDGPAQAHRHRPRPVRDEGQAQDRGPVPRLDHRRWRDEKAHDPRSALKNRARRPTTRTTCRVFSHGCPVVAPCLPRCGPCAIAGCCWCSRRTC